MVPPSTHNLDSQLTRVFTVPAPIHLTRSCLPKTKRRVCLVFFFSFFAAVPDLLRCRRGGATRTERAAHMGCRTCSRAWRRLRKTVDVAIACASSRGVGTAGGPHGLVRQRSRRRKGGCCGRAPAAAAVAFRGLRWARRGGSIRAEGRVRLPPPASLNCHKNSNYYQNIDTLF